MSQRQRLTSSQQREGLAWYALYSSDDGMETFYDRASNQTYLQYNDGIGRVGVRFDTSASGLTKAVRSVHVRGRKYGTPTGPITVNVRLGAGDAVQTTIGAFDIQNFPANTELSFAVRARPNTYQMTTNDIVTVEFPSNATNGFEIALSGVANPSNNYTGRSHNGSVYANTTSLPAILVKGF